MNFKRLLKLCLLSFCFTIFSCSKDDDNIVVVEFDKSAELNVDILNATSAVFEIVSGSSQNLQVGIRKKGASEFIFTEANSTYNGLEPGRIYETRLFVENSNNQSQFKTIEFITPPFDFIESTNSETGSNRLYIKSIPDYKHQLVLGTDNQSFSGDFNSALKLELINIKDENIKHSINYTINGNILEFIMPTDILENTEFSIDSYNLKYTIDGKSDFFRNSQLNNLKYVISVFDPKPRFFKVTEIERNRCEDIPSYSIRFIGSFLNSLTFSDFVIHDKVNLVLTRLDDGTELFLDNENQLGCLAFKRLFTSEIETEGGLSLIHTNQILILKYIESVEGSFRFTAGDYKIKANFSNDQGDFKTTEEFRFTIPALPFTYLWNLYKKVVDKVDVTDSELEECDLKESINFRSDGTFENRIFKTSTGACSASSLAFMGTWVKANNSDREGSDKYLTYLDTDINRENPITFYYANNNIVKKIVLETQADGSTKEATYFYKRGI
ncbi:hypothetical protein [Aquimarina algiphila]|uniref:hypothetical protein n=1 Tax=Aquimarina algiphila TaxID=2047982 RepID=UPI00232B9E48|nr:hypothetical protein [Aquimarina algiphila]